jgi:hypothetical protein
MDPASIPGELARLRAGTRIRLFHREGSDRIATSGTLLSVGAGEVTIAPDDGGELSVAVSAVTCFYVPKPSAGRASPFAALRAALRRVARAGEPVLLARMPDETPDTPAPETPERPPPAAQRGATDDPEKAAPALRR